MNLRALAVAASLSLSLSLPFAACASGGDGFVDDLYVPLYQVPEPEFKAYAAGNLGVVGGEFFRVYRVLAWRALHGTVLSPQDVDKLGLNGWRVGDTGDQPGDGVKEWLMQRKAVVGDGRDLPIFAVEVTGRNYVTYVNCPADALRRAAATLQDRAKTHGAAGAKAWLAGQDAVFANCSAAGVQKGADWVAPEPVLPADADAAAPPWLRADRSYQTAAALFYAGRFADARERFLAIAADTHSPWQPLGGYLAARCLIRQATLSGTHDTDAAAAGAASRMLVQARAELARLSATDPTAARLLGWVDVQVRPAERAAELARALESGPLSSPERVSMLNDYLRLMDVLDVTDGLSESAQPMTAWIGLMQSAVNPVATDAQRSATAGQARTHWQRDHDVAWLLPLFIQARRLADLEPEELRTAHAAATTSPAWQTLHWHLARLELVSGSPVEADGSIDATLAMTTLATSTRNRWLQLKLASARSVEAMLAAAPRTVPQPERTARVPIPDEGKADPVQGTDGDFARRVYRNLPLSRLAAMVGRSDYPPEMRTALVEVVFARALTLGDWAVADRVSDQVASTRQTTQGLYRRYRSARTQRDRRIAADLILVNSPEFNPSAVSDAGGILYWGCHDNDGRGDGLGPDPVMAVPAQFLTDAEQSQLNAERAELAALPVRTRWLADPLLAWAATKPDIVEAPKALHFLVASTRLECSSDRAKPNGPTPSRKAFDLLHALWPDSEWAGSTPYWF